jgi:5'-nucleotidase
MNVLITNDDGVFAPGLKALRAALMKEHHVLAVAPETERSAVGHAITLTDPIRVKEVREDGRRYGFALGGTPADCVRLGAGELADHGIDAVVSGVNQGPNVGVNVLYSGTVSAATEAAILGIPAMAVSLGAYDDPDFSAAAEVARRFLRVLPEMGLKKGVCLNVNVPAVPLADIAGVVWAPLETTPSGEVFDRRIDPRNNVYYWRGREEPPQPIDAESDYAWLARGYVTITPISFDLTNRGELSRLRGFRPAW